MTDRLATATNSCFFAVTALHHATGLVKRRTENLRGARVMNPTRRSKPSLTTSSRNWPVLLRNCACDSGERERQRKIAEERHLAEMERKRETIRLRRLLSYCGNWRTSADVRAFVAAVELSPRASAEEFASWKSWALHHAENIDPLRNGDLFDRLDAGERRRSCQSWGRICSDRAPKQEKTKREKGRSRRQRLTDQTTTPRSPRSLIRRRDARSKTIGHQQ